jgi:hypothetical protein
VGEESLEAACVHRFERGEDRLEVRLSRRDDDAAAVAAVESSMAAHAGDPVALEGASARSSERGLLVGATEGRHALLVQITSGCEPSRAARLLPLLRSLVR